MLASSVRMRRIIMSITPSPKSYTHFHSSPKQQQQPLTRNLILNNYTNATNLFQNAVASPSVLFTASHNISTTQNTPFHPYSLVQELRENRFDVSACCVTITRNGSSLVLPNLKLKVVIEAVRMVLEAVYDEWFVTFCYGGRIGMGRHTAIRYFKILLGGLLLGLSLIDLKMHMLKTCVFSLNVRSEIVFSLILLRGCLNVRFWWLNWVVNSMRYVLYFTRNSLTILSTSDTGFRIKGAGTKTNKNRCKTTFMLGKKDN